MTISDETLMAFADGELDAVARAAVESAMREDPQIEARVARHRALRQRVQAAYLAELSEDVPERLLIAAKGGARTQESRVVDLQDARAARERNAARARPVQRRWRTAGTIAASVVAGVGLGLFMWGRTELPLMQGTGGALVARGQLAKALSSQLAAEQSPGSAVRIGLTFVAKSGGYCRTFAMSGAALPSGLACRHGEEWRIQALTQAADDRQPDSDYRTAGSATSAAIIKSVEEMIAGEPLDQAGEKAAREHGWRAGDAP
jgi:anti-sigma factor RsiW